MPQLSDNFKTQLVEAVKNKNLSKLSKMCDHARIHGVKYNDLQAASGIELPEWDALMEEIDNMESQE